MVACNGSMPNASRVPQEENWTHVSESRRKMHEFFLMGVSLLDPLSEEERATVAAKLERMEFDVRPQKSPFWIVMPPHVLFAAHVAPRSWLRMYDRTVVAPVGWRRGHRGERVRRRQPLTRLSFC